jgi:hypothetical protein
MISWRRSVVSALGVLLVFFVLRERRGAESSPGKLSAAEPKTRAAAMHETIEVFRGECVRNAGGDWDRWIADLAAVRADLAAKAKAAKPYDPGSTGYFEARGAVLEGRDRFPLFESAPAHYLIHIVEPASLDPFRHDRPVVAGSRWLERRGIDVIFVPVPKMTEIYPEFFTDHCPSDRIIAPRIRQIMLELLEADVEVVDLWYAFQAERDTSAELLYQPADPHWAPRAQEIAARLVADRLKRYDFVVKAQAGPRICKGPALPYPPASEGAAFKALNPEQQKRATEHQPRSSRIPRKFVSPQFNHTSPVACIGDSYNCGFMELLGRELNMAIHPLAAGGNTSDAFKNFLRDSELIKDCRVVIWLVCNSSLKNPWPIPSKIHETEISAARK